MSTLAHHFEEGGWGMYPILFFQILAIGVIVERAIYRQELDQPECSRHEKK